ncbi:hypothetical protein D3C83_55230 [compost metagenome]
MLVAMARTRFWMSLRTFSSNARMVPSISISSGTMFDRLPPLKRPIVTTAGASVMFTVRLMIVCSAITICDPTTIGSMPPQGIAPCVWRPLTLITNESALAISGPGR